MGALTEEPDGLWKAELDTADSQYRLCANYDQVSVCNWVIPVEESSPFCGSCRLNRVIPDLSSERNRVAWFRLEVAKRRMLYTLLGLRLRTQPKGEEGSPGLGFEFLEESGDGDAKRVFTGHDNGLITINIAEADDMHREKERTLQKEPYRTVLGHFRHEIGHYFWDVLIANSRHLALFRDAFGDEREDYQKALERHYNVGPRIGDGGRGRTCASAEAQRRAAHAAPGSFESALSGLRCDDRVVAIAHLRLEQLKSRVGASRQLPVHLVRGRHRKAALHSHHHR